MDELEDLTQVAGRRITGIGGQIRANLIPPLWREIPTYTREKLQADLLAGATIAVITIPQAVGFALVAGLPIQAVLATCVVGALVCSCYSSSRHLVFGPTNTISIILAGAILSLADVPLTPLEKVLLLGGLIGLIQVAAGLTKTGQLTQFISRTVIIAYTTAVGVLIAVGQIGNLLGIAHAPGVSLPATVRHLVASFFTLNFNWMTAATGVVSLGAIYALRRWRPRWPDGLIVLILASAASDLLGLDHHGVPLVRDLGEISRSMPIFIGFPLNEEAFQLLPRITSTAIAIALLGMLEAVSIAKGLAAKSGQRIDPNQELIGMGLGNLAATAFGAMPGSASFLRSAANLQSGGRTQFATVFSSLGVLLAVLLVSPLLNYIPVAALAAYLIAIALRLYNPEQILIARHATRADAAVFWVTLSAALFLQLDTAIYVGIGVSLVLFLQKASAPSLVEHAFNEQGQLAQIDAPAERNTPQVSIVHVEGDLFFGAADIFQDGVRRLAEDPHIRVFILRMKNARHLDATTAIALGQLVEFLHSQDRHLLISGVHGDVAAVLKRSGLVEKIGLDNIFPAEENPTLATKKALQRAQALIGVKPELRVFYPQPAAGS
ncbi:MAG: SulP family inorganic anion transporter [Opitutae bacterium]